MALNDFFLRMALTQNFIKTDRFVELMEIFRQAVLEGQKITTEDVCYQEEDYPFTADDFRRAVETVFRNHAPKIVSDSGDSFPVSAINYGGLGFTIMVGQGSSYTIGPEIEGVTPVLI